jgi:hypothetical protein
MANWSMIDRRALRSRAQRGKGCIMCYDLALGFRRVPATVRDRLEGKAGGANPCDLGRRLARH